MSKSMLRRSMLLASLPAVLTNPASATDDWSMVLETSLAEVWEWVEAGKAEFLSSSGLSWPDGQQAVVIYFRVPDRLWRCIENFDSSLRYTGAFCYRLEKPTKGRDGG